MDYDVSVEWKMYVCMTYISRCGAIKYKFSNTKPIMWGLQLSLVSEWRWLYNNQGPTGASAEWVWHGSGVHIYPWGGHWLDMTPSHLTHEHHTSIKGGGGNKQSTYWLLTNNRLVCWLRWSQLTKFIVHEQSFGLSTKLMQSPCDVDC